MTKLLEGRVALVTGSTGDGMGRSIALTLGREGAKVALNYGTRQPGNAAAAELVLEAIRALGGDGIICPADTKDENQAKEMVRRTRNELGRIDILVLSAGGEFHLVDWTEIKGWHTDVLRAEIGACFYLLEDVLPDMREQQWGRIIGIGAAHTNRWSGPPYDYETGKVGRTYLIQSLALSEYVHGITANVIAPATVARWSFDKALSAVNHGDSWTKRNITTPQDIAELVTHLCSEEAKFITGSVIEFVPDPVFKGAEAYKKMRWSIGE